MFHLLKNRTSIDIFRTEKCKVTFGLKYMFLPIKILVKYLVNRKI